MKKFWTIVFLAFLFTSCKEVDFKGKKLKCNSFAIQFYYKDKKTNLCFFEKYRRLAHVPCTKKVLLQIAKYEACK